MAHPVDRLPAIHPGSFLRDELDVLGISARKFAEHIHVPYNAVTGIMNGERSISAQMAIRLGLAFGTTAQYWLNLQSIYDLKRAQADMPAEALSIEVYVQSDHRSEFADRHRRSWRHDAGLAAKQPRIELQYRVSGKSRSTIPIRVARTPPAQAN